MKIKLQYIRFNFKDEEKNYYDVVCNDATRGNNVFRSYKNGKLLGTIKPQGGHVNKTSALFFLKKQLQQ